MTSTNMFSGNFAEKPSSRVLRPPGGGPSNIFGLPEEQSKPQAPKPAQTVDIQAKQAVHQKSEIVEKQVLKPTPVVQSETRSFKNKFQGGAFNPITGESIGKADEPVKQTNSIAVKQPPGGASSKLW